MTLPRCSRCSTAAPAASPVAPTVERNAAALRRRGDGRDRPLRLDDRARVPRRRRARRASPGATGPTARHRAVRGRSCGRARALLGADIGSSSIGRRSTGRPHARADAPRRAPSRCLASLALLGAAASRASPRSRPAPRPRRRRRPGRPPRRIPRRSSRRPRAAPSTRTARPAASSSTVPGSSVRDPAGNGDLQGWQRRPSTDGLDDDDGPQRLERDRREPGVSYTGAVGWYRKDFRLPETAARPDVGHALRVGQLPRARLAQRQPDRHATPAPTCRSSCACRNGFLKRSGVNRLVVPRRQPPLADGLPAGQVSTRAASRSAAGGTTAGSCARSTCARSTTSTSTTRRRPPRRPVRDVRGDRQLDGHGAQRGRQGAARHDHRRASGRAGQARHARDRAQARSPPHEDAADRQARASGSPTAPYLYDASLLASRRKGPRAPGVHAQDRRARRARRRRRAPAASTAAPLDVRGVGAAGGLAHEAASRSTTRRASRSSRWVRELGATLIRAHYPLHPYTLERADELGLLVWSEIPVYQVDTEELEKQRSATPRVQACSRTTSSPTATTRRSCCGRSATS